METKRPANKQGGASTFTNFLHFNKSELYKWPACVISRRKYNNWKHTAPHTVIAKMKWMRGHVCRIKRGPLSADCDVSAHCISLSKTVPAAKTRAEKSCTFCLLPGNLNFKFVDECVRACVWTWSPLCLSSSSKLHFLFYNSEHLLDGFLKHTRLPKPCQISAHSVRRARVLSDWLHFELFFFPPLPVASHIATSPTWLSRNAYIMGQNLISHQVCCITRPVQNSGPTLFISLEQILIGVHAQPDMLYLGCCCCIW